MVRERVKRSEPCAHESCGSRRFYLEDDGYIYCDQGHQQTEQGTTIAEDTGELVITGRKQRRVDSDAESTATSRSGLSKAQAYEHFLLCLQLVLRKQVFFLIHQRQFPSEFEHVLRDLWALRIQKLRPDIVQDPGTDDESRSQMFSSQSEGETSTDADRAAPFSTRSRSRSRLGHNDTFHGLKLQDLVALLQIGMLLLRLPVSTADTCRWIADGDLLYIYSSKAVPPDLRRQLSGHYQAALEPGSLLRSEDLQLTVCVTAGLFNDCYGMVVPAINDALLLYRWIRVMILPIEVFAACRRLSTLLSIDYHYAPSHRLHVEKLPELQLMAILIVSTKLLFPMDNVERYSTSPDDLSALNMDWDAWSSNFKTTTEAATSLSFFQAFIVSEADCLAMEGDNLDRYLSWYQDNIASDHISERGKAARDAHFRRAMLDTFADDMMLPSSSSEHPLVKDDEIGNQLRQAQSKLQPRPIIADRHRQTLNDIHVAGTFYRRYRKSNDLLAGPAPVLMLYELAAKHSGVGVELLTRSVFAIEKRLEKHEIDLRD